MAARTITVAEEPLALIRQREYISELKPGLYVHVNEERIAEWPVEFLARPGGRRHDTELSVASRFDELFRDSAR